LGNYKLLEYYENSSVQLFDLENDLGEQSDLSKVKPAITAKLLKMLRDWRRQLDAKMPQPKATASARNK
jgi:cob(I)alamin adenosyltransferase